MVIEGLRPGAVHRAAAPAVPRRRRRRSRSSTSASRRWPCRAPLPGSSPPRPRVAAGDEVHDTETGVDLARRLAPGTLVAGRYRVLAVAGVGGDGRRLQGPATRSSAWTSRSRSSAPSSAGTRRGSSRFRRELVLARQVTHKNVVRIHDIGESGGLRFLTMRYVEGRSLLDLLRVEGSLSAERAVRIARQVAEALGQAHDAQVVHRDLKPGNVLLEADDTAYVADFGVARSLEGGALTRQGAIVGTPGLPVARAGGRRPRGRPQRPVFARHSCSTRWSPASCPSAASRRRRCSRSASRERRATPGRGVPRWLRRGDPEVPRAQPRAALRVGGRADRRPRPGRVRPPRSAGPACGGGGGAARGRGGRRRPARPRPRSAARAGGARRLPRDGPRSGAGGGPPRGGRPPARRRYRRRRPGVGGHRHPRHARRRARGEPAPAGRGPPARGARAARTCGLDARRLDERAQRLVAELLEVDRLVLGAVRRAGGAVRVDLPRGVRAGLRAAVVAGRSRATAGADGELFAALDRLGEALLARARRGAARGRRPAGRPAPSPPARAFEEARGRLAVGDYGRAAPALERAVAADPDWPAALERLAETYQNLGYEQKARAAAERAARLGRRRREPPRLPRAGAARAPRRASGRRGDELRGAGRGAIPTTPRRCSTSPPRSRGRARWRARRQPSSARPRWTAPTRGCGSCSAATPSSWATPRGRSRTTSCAPSPFTAASKTSRDRARC